MPDAREPRLQAISLDLADRYCQYMLEDGEHDAGREALQAYIVEPIADGIELLRKDYDDAPDRHTFTVNYRGVFIGNIWPPDDFMDEPDWSNYPAPIIRVDDETPVTAGYGFDGENGKQEAIDWFVERLGKIKRGEWRRGDGR